jgi:hypothetical protein
MKTAWASKFVRPYLENTHHKKRAGRVAQGVGPDFKFQYCKKRDIPVCGFLIIPLLTHENSDIQCKGTFDRLNTYII